jgi:tetratricopeptide (TPR) repeat protein
MTTTLTLPPPAKSAADLLATTRADRLIVEDFQPLAESIEWELGRLFYQTRGSLAFQTTEHVPFEINNDGTLSAHAAEVLFANLLAREASQSTGAVSHEAVGAATLEAGCAVSPEAGCAGSLEARCALYALEIGPGTGLFARFLLDAFRDLCQERQKDFYDRLCLVLADSSKQMLDDIERAGVLGPHRDRCRLVHADACDIARALAEVCGEGESAGKPPVGAGTEDGSLATSATAVGTLTSSATRVESLTTSGTGDGSLTTSATGMGRLCAVFLNYVLDSLPAAVLEFDGDVVKELRVRTCLARNFNAKNGLGLTPETIAQRAGTRAPAARRTLIDLYPYFTLDYDYFPLENGRVPFVEVAAALTRGQAADRDAGDTAAGMPPLAGTPQGGLRRGTCAAGRLAMTPPLAKHVLHSYGAIECLEACLGLLSADGFILINDYGPTALDEPAEGAMHQKFSGSTSIGLNFALLGEYFRKLNCCRWIEPANDREGIHSRLLGRNPSEAAVGRFREFFDKAREEWLNEPVARARQLQQWGQNEAALGAYQEALARQPRNWRLMGEAAKCLMFATRDFASALRLAATAISLNSARSADLWDTLGDAYLGLEMADSAALAYQRALAIDATDVRARLGLAHGHAARANYAEAMRLIAEAITLDKSAQYRETLMQKQAQVIMEIDHQNQQEARAMVTRCGGRLGGEGPRR